MGVFLISSLFFFLFICKTGYVFSTHSYYVIPYVPVMALIAGYALEQIKNKRVRVAMIFIIMTEAILNQQNDFRISDEEKCKLGMEEMVDKFSSRKDLFVINGGANPQEMYFLNRRGWSENTEKLADEANILTWKQKGCKFAIIDKHKDGQIDLSKSYKVIYKDEHFVVYSLKN